MKATLIQTLVSFYKFLTRQCPPAVIHRNKDLILSKLDIYDNQFTTIHGRPKSNLSIQSSPFILNSKMKIAIVMQGPVIEDEDFTIETIKIYKKNFPTHEIIISTWDTISSDLKHELSKLPVHLVLSKLPEYNGPLNINYQITSSAAGIKKAKELNSDFVYKTRTDQRMYATNLSEYFLFLIKTYPLANDSSLNNRLIVSSFTTLKFRPYGIGDMLMFGETNDMLKYWDSKHDLRKISMSDWENKSILDYAKFRLAETYLCTNFLNRIDYPMNWTLKDSWEVYKKYFYIVDHAVIDMFWFKYDWRQSRRFEYYSTNTMQIMNSKDWTILYYTDLETTEIPEHILTLKEGIYVHE